MNAIILAFDNVEEIAKTAKRAYKAHGPDAGMAALADLEDRSEALRGHLAIDAARVKGRRSRIRVVKRNAEVNI